MIRALLLLVLLGGCADEQPRVAWLEVAGLDGRLKVEGHDGDAVSVGGHLLIRRDRSREIGFRFRPEAESFQLLHDGRSTLVRLVAQPTLRSPRLNIARSRRRGALLVEIERQRGEDAWTLYIGRPPLAEDVACGTLDGSWLRCE
jgi:hypothetical protein